ncbi:MAG: hypothetical protein O6952_02675, partial [Planctomycetota bacterium]|nr:hypothetical protein [Planctomycetota bacterium]
DQVRLSGCVRGLLGTEPTAHAPGISADIQSYPPVSVFERLDERRMIVKSTAGFPREGYLAFDRGPAFDVDIWAYHRVRGNGRLDLCEDVRGDPTFLGGMYGTRPTAPSQGDIVVAMPYRYFDRYAPRVDSARAAYFETSRRVPGAIWRGIRWDGTTPPGTEIRVLARVDGKPDWSAEPGKPVDGHTLYLFNDPGARNRIDEMGDQVEIRIHFTYKDGAFKRNLGQQSDEWKDTPTLRSLTVEYHRPVRVLHREEMVF